MKRTIRLRLTGRQYAALKTILYPGDGNEAVALALCGVGTLTQEENISKVVCINEIIPIKRNMYIERTPTKCKWKTDFIPKLLKKANNKNQALLKIHSHPNGEDSFSSFDDASDYELFRSISGWLDTDLPGISAIMLPDEKIIARSVDDKGSFNNILSTIIVGDNIILWNYSDDISNDVPDYSIRTKQVFGKGTTNLLSKLTIGVVGASGTGSPVIEMLNRLSVGNLVIVDPDIMEYKNVTRIYNSTMEDAKNKRFKVDVLAEAILRNGLPTKVVPVSKSTFNPDVVEQLAQCDILFGCIDSIDGRDLLNRLSAFYIIPYFDLGVRLIADGKGGISQVCGSVNYLQPDGSSLLSRGIYTLDELSASSLRRTNPDQYKEEIKSKYIKGINEDSPAVISVNTLIASLAVNEFLARIHPFKDDPNSEFSLLSVSLSQTRFVYQDDGKPCEIIGNCTGRGDVTPLLDMPALC